MGHLVAEPFRSHLVLSQLQGHCISFKSKFRSVVEQVQQQYPDTEAYGVSCISNSGMCRKYEIDGYPAVFVIPEYAPVAQWTEVLPHRFSFEAVEHVFREYDEKNQGNPIQTSVKQGAAQQQQQGMYAPAMPQPAQHHQDMYSQQQIAMPQVAHQNTYFQPEPAQHGDMYVQQEPPMPPPAHEHMMYSQQQLPAMPERELERNMRPVASNGQPFHMEGEGFDLVDAQSEPSDRREEDTDDDGRAKNRDDDTVQTGEDSGEQDAADSIMITTDNGYGGEQPVEEGIHFAARQGSIPMAGAEAARGMEREMDRWKQYHQQKRKRKHRIGFRRPQPPAEAAYAGATKTMRAHQLNTPEFAERIAQIGKTLTKVKGRKRSAAAVEKIRNKQKPFKKVLKKEKFAEKIPIIKMLPTIKMSAEEELILDASLSFLQGIRHGVFRSDAALSPARQHALYEFLNVMSVGLPPEWGT